MIAVAAGALAAAVVTWRFHFFCLFELDARTERLAQVLALRPGMSVADSGAGSGRARGGDCTVRQGVRHRYATELTVERRAEIERRARLAGLEQLAGDHGGRRRHPAADACRNAIYMCAASTHIAPSRAFAADVARALRQGGRVAVIGFLGARLALVSRVRSRCPRRIGHCSVRGRRSAAAHPGPDRGRRHVPAGVRNGMSVGLSRARPVWLALSSGRSVVRSTGFS